MDDSNRKPNKIWVDHGSEFYNNKFKSFLKENDIEMYLTHNEGKSVVTERFIKTLKNKINKHMTTIGVGDNVRISKYKIFLLKVIHLIGVKKFLLLIKYKTLSLGLI